MKKMIQFFVLAIAFSSAAFAKTNDLPAINQVIPFTSLDPQAFLAICQGAYPELAIECAQGTELPIKLFLKTNLLSLKFDPNLSITINTNFYFRCIKNRTYFSTDLVHWEKSSRFFENHLGNEIQINDFTFSIPQFEDDSESEN